MHVISRAAIREFCSVHPVAEVALDVWYRLVKSASWDSIEDVRKLYPHADKVGRLTVFNIHGNRFRLIAEINYKNQTLYIRRILTHAEYSKGGWSDGR